MTWMPRSLSVILSVAAAGLGLVLAFRTLRSKSRSSQQDRPQLKSKNAKPKSNGSNGDVKLPQRVRIFLEEIRSSGAVPGVSEEHALRLFPRRYEHHDHVIVAKLNEEVPLDEFKSVASCFARSFKPHHVDVVIVDTEGIAGELRRPVHEVAYEADGSDPKDFATGLSLWKRAVGKQFGGRTPKGDAVTQEEVSLFRRMCASKTFTMHIENGVKYAFDVLQVMFCSGNTTERMLFGNIKATDETVVDMFAGIGYFTLPLAIHGGVKKIVALEKNPDSCRCLRFNALLAGVGDRIVIHEGDNREVTGDTYVGACDRVLMGYIPSCVEFLPRAWSFLRVEGGRRVGVIHYHFLAGRRAEARDHAEADIVRGLGEAIRGSFRMVDIRQVKSYAPNLWHYVADVAFS